MKLPTTEVPMNAFELGMVMMALWQPAAKEKGPARALWLKLKLAAIELGVEWIYGDPWEGNVA